MKGNRVTRVHRLEVHALGVSLSNQVCITIHGNQASQYYLEHCTLEGNILEPELKGKIKTIHYRSQTPISESEAPQRSLSYDEFLILEKPGYITERSSIAS